jgi:hypothetical protein
LCNFRAFQAHTGRQHVNARHELTPQAFVLQVLPVFRCIRDFYKKDFEGITPINIFKRYSLHTGVVKDITLFCINYK